MALTFNQFFSAIAEQESGGRYNAVGVWVNGHRAYGKYQVMDFNIPQWTAKHYGKRLTPEQFRNNPKAQEAVARGVLKGYWDKYGARGAAAAWYSGNPSLHNSTKSQPGGPSIKAYVDSVLAKAGKYPAGGSTSSGSTAAYASGSAGMTPAETAESYGFMEALFNSNAELKKLFKRAVAGSWSSGKFQAALRDTKWWKTTSQSARDFLMLKYGDPATANQKLAQNRVKVEQMARQMGLSGASVSKANINSITLQYTMNGWTDEQLRRDLGKRLVMWGDHRYGEAGETADKLAEFAYNMGITVTETWLDNAAKAVVSGTGMIQDSEDSIRRMAKAMFPQWQKQIDSGQTVMDLAAPYLQTMSQVLEIPPGSIDLFDKTIKGALQYKDPQTGANSVKSLWEFEIGLKNDERWKSTKNAQDSMMQVAHQVLSDFGVKY